MPTITASHIKGVGLGFQVLVVGRRGSNNTILDVRQSGLESRL